MVLRYSIDWYGGARAYLKWQICCLIWRVLGKFLQLFPSLICRMPSLTICFMALRFSCKLGTILKILLSLGKLTHLVSITLIPTHLLGWRSRAKKDGGLILPRPPKVTKIIPAGFHSGLERLTVFTLTGSSFPYLLNEVTHIYFSLISLFNFHRNSNSRKSHWLLWFWACALGRLLVESGSGRNLPWLFHTHAGQMWGHSCLELMAQL